MNNNKIIEMNGYQLRFILIEPGTYTIGLTPEQAQQIDAKTGELNPIEHGDIQTQTQKVNFEGGWFLDTLITKKLYYSIVNNDETGSIDALNGADLNAQNHNDWAEKIKNFCNLISNEFQIQPAYSHLNVNMTSGVRLPTEEEWEIAIRQSQEGIIHLETKYVNKTRNCKAIPPYKEKIYDAFGGVPEACNQSLFEEDENFIIFRGGSIETIQIHKLYEPFFVHIRLYCDFLTAGFRLFIPLSEKEKIQLTEPYWQSKVNELQQSNFIPEHPISHIEMKTLGKRKSYYWSIDDNNTFGRLDNHESTNEFIPLFKDVSESSNDEYLKIVPKQFTIHELSLINLGHQNISLNNQTCSTNQEVKLQIGHNKLYIYNSVFNLSVTGDPTLAITLENEIDPSYHVVLTKQPIGISLSSGNLEICQENTESCQIIVAPLICRSNSTFIIFNNTEEPLYINQVVHDQIQNLIVYPQNHHFIIADITNITSSNLKQSIILYAHVDI